MNKGLKIYAICFGICLMLALLASGGGISTDILTFTGLISLIIGILLLVIALVALLARSNEWAKAFAIAGGLLLLTGTVTCSVFPINMNIH
ncbi:MAG: hypothetical protein SFU21_15060 [Flavihumibacter sp.]|nr:hypothetical protein [Flavihumibacter sp.]